MKVKMSDFYKSGRRIAVKIDPYDTYNMDNTLAHIILPALIQLKMTKHGVPGEFADVGGEDWSGQDCFDFYKETHNEAFDEGVKRWDEVLDKMIWSFYQLIQDDYTDRYHHGAAKYDWVKTDKLYPNPITGKDEETYRMVDTNPDDHWYDHVGHQLHEERIQEGLELFGKYYRNLWD